MNSSEYLNGEIESTHSSFLKPAIGSINSINSFTQSIDIRKTMNPVGSKKMIEDVEN